ncbi:MAG: hypothetical protein Q8P98_03030, partial [Candidatus Rokubacteria bacterium]|nr:hypothetical protein [Candidatus Rokubacteria bacterium]
AKRVPSLPTGPDSGIWREAPAVNLHLMPLWWRVERPEDIAGAFARAKKATEGGQAALLEFITSQETRFSNRGVLR